MGKGKHAAVAQPAHADNIQCLNSPLETSSTPPRMPPLLQLLFRASLYFTPSHPSTPHNTLASASLVRARRSILRSIILQSLAAAFDEVGLGQCSAQFRVDTESGELLGVSGLRSRDLAGLLPKFIKFCGLLVYLTPHFGELEVRSALYLRELAGGFGDCEVQSVSLLGDLVELTAHLMKQGVLFICLLIAGRDQLSTPLMGFFEAGLEVVVKALGPLAMMLGVLVVIVGGRISVSSIACGRFGIGNFSLL